MNDENKKLVISLADLLEKTSCEFMLDKVNSEISSLTDIINLAMSAHMSSLFNIMSTVTEDNEIATHKVRIFIAKMIAHLAENNAMTDVELLNKRN